MDQPKIDPDTISIARADVTAAIRAKHGEHTDALAPLVQQMLDRMFDGEARIDGVPALLWLSILEQLRDGITGALEMSVAAEFAAGTA